MLEDETSKVMLSKMLNSTVESLAGRITENLFPKARERYHCLLDPKYVDNYRKIVHQSRIQKKKKRKKKKKKKEGSKTY